MTPDSPSSSGGSSLPQRHRPSLGNLAKDTTELDLWALDGGLDSDEAPDASQVEEVPRKPVTGIPGRRESNPPRKEQAADLDFPLPKSAAEHIRVNVNRSRSKDRSFIETPGHTKTENDFEDLDHWEDAVTEPEIEELPGEGIPEAEAVTELVNLPEPPVEQEITAPSLPEITPRDTVDDEFSPVVRENAVPISLRPHLALSKVERIGLIALLVLLLAGGAAIFVFSLNRLPKELVTAKTNDFPLKGNHLTVKSARSYWRAPVMEGASPDTFRRGTKLLPVLELSVSGGPAAIRVRFKNEDQSVVGDSVTKAVLGEGTLKIAATAGFDDLGMHAAYRTGESKPWTIEVLEAPSENSPGEAFRKLFEIDVSTDRH